jgi:hypothetical protein
LVRLKVEGRKKVRFIRDIRAIRGQIPRLFLTTDISDDTDKLHPVVRHQKRIANAQNFNQAIS